MANPKHIAKPAAAGVKPLTKEEQAAQVARFFTQKHEALFQLILANLIQAGTLPRQAVDLAIEAADYSIEKLYPLPEESKEK